MGAADGYAVSTPPTQPPPQHPVRRTLHAQAARNRAYAELHCLTNFSFLRGASHPAELVVRAAELGYAALAITDRNSLAGVVRAHLAARQHGLRLLIGAEITPEDAPPVVLLATDRAAYGRLARLITAGRLRVRKGACRLYFADVAEHAEGLLALVVPPMHPPDAGELATLQERLGAYRAVFGNRTYLATALAYEWPDEERVALLSGLGRAAGVPLVAANHVHYHDPQRRYLQDVLTCVREKCTVTTAGRHLFPNAERHLRPRDEVWRRYAPWPELVARTLDVAERCRFSLDELRYEYPHELCPPGMTPSAYLAQLTWAGARERYPGGLPDKVRRTLEAELALIAELRYEYYFLTVWDLVRFARERGILCQGRGSAANSAVCYALGVTAVDPARIDLLFERFISRERNEPPDIDVDFEHFRREEVFQYIYGKYGRERAGITAEVISYRARSAIRDVGKALGLSLDRVDRMAKAAERWDREVPDAAATEAGLSAEDRTVQCVLRLTRQLIGFPRHLSQHVGGFVITASPLCEIVPLENGAMPGRTFIEWDKDDIDALGILKVDCLALGMLTAISKCFGLLGPRGGPTRLTDIPPEDPAVYDMLSAADTVGVFQVESRAQMSMLPRLRPRNFYDLVIEVAIVRPGPIQGGMIHPFLRRRNGQEPITFPDERIRDVLAKTLGVPLFQEQVMRLAMVAAGFSPGEADQLRRAMAAWKRYGDLTPFQTRLLRGMLANGYSREFAEVVFKQISGFAEYGFPESHAASFALLVYVSAWLKRYHPAAFCAALLNAQPLGFYSPAQLVADARRHGVRVLPVDVCHSDYESRLEDVPRRGRSTATAKPPGASADPATWGHGGPALRLGMRLVRGLSREKVAGVVAAQQDGDLRSLRALAARPDVSRETLVRLAAADAFRSLGLSRRAALWEILALDRVRQGTLFDELVADETPVVLPEMDIDETVVHDYDAVGLSLNAHPIELVRTELDAARVLPNGRLAQARQRQRVRVAGLVTVRQRPVTAKGMVFMTLEDETGMANLILRPPVWEREGRPVRHKVALVAEGVVERQEQVVHVQVSRLHDLSDVVGELRHSSRDFR
jgi:error-prone DNA polymerase